MKHYWKWAIAQWDRVLGWTCVGGGALLVLVGARNVTNAGDQLDQLSYLASGSALGLFLLGVGAILILSADIRDEWDKLEEIHSKLRRSEQSGRASGGDRDGHEDGCLGGEPEDEEDEPVGDRDSKAKTVRALGKVGFPALAVAGMGMVAGAAGVRQTLEEGSALRWTQLSGASLTLAVFVVGLVYLRARQAIDSGFAVVARRILAPGGLSPDDKGTAERKAPSGDYYVVDASQLYHTAACGFLRFTVGERISAEDARRRRLVPCQVCRQR